MNRRLVVLVALGLGPVTAPGLRAQAPAVPPPPPAVAPPAGIPGGAAVPAAAAAPPANLFSFLLPTAAQKQALQEKLCKCGVVKLAQGFVGPLSLYSGGLIGGCKCCPDETQPDPAALAEPETSAEGAAARIKKAEAEAAARRQAVRYLGTVDCERYPEAEEALINALRGDTNECVRFEAALALGRGCCCTRNTINALALTVSASRKDGNPAERSPRVRAAAAAALQNCLEHYCDIRPIDPALLERPEVPAPPEVPPGAPPPVPGPEVASGERPEQVVARARQTLERFAGSGRLQPLPVMAEPPLAEESAAPGKPAGKGRDLMSIFRRAVATAGPPDTGPPPPLDPPAPVRTASRYPAPPPSRPAAPPIVRPSPPPAPEVAPEPARRLPPTGKRDLFNIFVHSLSPEGVR